VFSVCFYSVAAKRLKRTRRKSFSFRQEFDCSQYEFMQCVAFLLLGAGRKPEDDIRLKLDIKRIDAAIVIAVTVAGAGCNA
jgi:hypothetical protein